ncbi:hypothetical protein KPL53_22870, partial [Clostridium estertheticum]|nr:hypothetical protein [Clostridium estertheticum]
MYYSSKMEYEGKKNYWHAEDNNESDDDFNRDHNKNKCNRHDCDKCDRHDCDKCHRHDCNTCHRHHCKRVCPTGATGSTGATG